MDGLASILLNATMYIPEWHPLIGKDIFSLLMFINMGVINTFVSIFGLCTNIIVMVTFTKLGFRDTINISLTALTVIDFASLVCLLWLSICFIPSFSDGFSVAIDFTNVNFIVGGMQRAYFTLMSGFVTSLIACERCLCVLRPLQIRVLLSKRKVLTVIFSTSIFMSVPFIPLCYIFSVVWIFDPETNRTVLSVTHKDHLEGVQSLCFSVCVVLNIATYLVVTICTVVIVWKLASQSAWRAGKTKENASSISGCPDAKADGNKVVSGKDRRATMTVILIASMYIVCFFPGTALTLTMALVPNFNTGKIYNNFYNVMWAIAYTFEGICSTANIAIYVKTSTRFKEAFIGLFIMSAELKKTQLKGNAV